MDPGFNFRAMRLFRIVAGIGVALASMPAAPAPTAAAKRAGEAVACKAQGSPARLDVRCPTATVAELLAALQQATGLRSEYPPELGRARVSITLRRASLPEVLDRALSAFNFAVWTDDQRSPSVTWLKLVEMRRTVEGPEQSPARQEAAMPSAAVVPASAAARPPSEAASTSAAMPPSSEVAPASAAVVRSMANFSPPHNKAEMALVLKSFARSVTPGTPLEAPPLDPGSAMPPVSTSPVIMPGVEMPR